MRYWQVGLTTRDGAENAASSGGLACFIVAGLGVIGILISAGLVGMTLGLLIGAGVEIAVFIMAGIRLRRYRGAYWGALAAVFLGLEILLKLAAFATLLGTSTGSTGGIGGLVIDLALMPPLVNGVRGAFALRRETFAEDVADVFS